MARRFIEQIKALWQKQTSHNQGRRILDGQNAKGCSSWLYSSLFRTTSSGVPQGSVLVPFLFLLYINATSYDIANNLPLSADDNSLYIIVDKCMKTATNSQTLDQDKISEWHLWAVNYNPSKTENLDFDRKKTPFSPHVIFGAQGPTVHEVECPILLGINFQSDDGWKLHVKTIHEKACKRG